MIVVYVKTNNTMRRNVLNFPFYNVLGTKIAYTMKVHRHGNACCFFLRRLKKYLPYNTHIKLFSPCRRLQ